MTDLIVSIIILAAWIIGCTAYYLRLRQLERRRAHRAQMRRIRRYCVTLQQPDLSLRRMGGTR